MGMAGAPRSGIIEKQVQAAKFVFDPGEERPHGAGIANIRGNGDHAAARSAAQRGGPLQFGRAPSRQRHKISRPLQRQAHRAPNPTPAPVTSAYPRRSVIVAPMVFQRLCGFLDLYAEPLTECTESGLELIEPGGVTQVQETVDLRQVATEAARQLGLSHLGGQHGGIEP